MTDFASVNHRSGIYRIINIETGKFYLGSSKHIDRRFYLHKWSLRRGDHHSITLQRAWNLHGADKFAFEVMRLCAVADLKSIEQVMLDELQSFRSDIGYNISSKATHPAGVKYSEERRLRASESRKGKPIFKNNPETMARLLAAVHRGKDHHMFGKSMPPATREAIARARAGKPAWNKGIASPFRGVPHSAEWSANISAAKQKYTPSISKLTPEQVIAIRRMKATEGHSNKVIGAMFGVSQDAICSIISGRTWAHLNSQDAHAN
jgi:group I intron endonuclease